MFRDAPECSIDAEQDGPRADGPGLDLPPRQMTAARLLPAGRGVGEGARALGGERPSVSRWKRDPAFRAELRRRAAAVTPPPRPP